MVIAPPQCKTARAQGGLCATGLCGPPWAASAVPRRLGSDPRPIRVLALPKKRDGLSRWRTRRRNWVMPTSLIPFPSFDPVLVSIGPFAIRWYALAYICGILLGWLYARAIIANERYWGGPAPMTVLDFDDFILWVTLGIILGGRTGYVLFYNLPHFLEHPIEILAGVERRHVVPWRLSRLRRRRDMVRPSSRRADALARRRHLRGRADRAPARAARELHQWRAVGPGHRRAVGDDLSARWPAAAPSEPALRGRPRRARAVGRSWPHGPGGRAAAPRPHPRRLRDDLRGDALVLRILPRARPAARLPVGPHHHGHAALHPACSSSASRWPCPRCGANPCIPDGRRAHPAGRRNPPPHRARRADVHIRVHDAVPLRPRARLLHEPRPLRRGRRFRHRAGNQPDVRRIDRAVGGRGMARDGLAGPDPDHRARPRPRHHDARRAAGGARRSPTSAGRRGCI